MELEKTYEELWLPARDGLEQHQKQGSVDEDVARWRERTQREQDRSIGSGQPSAGNNLATPKEREPAGVEEAAFLGGGHSPEGLSSGEDAAQAARTKAAVARRLQAEADARKAAAASNAAKRKRGGDTALLGASVAPKAAGLARPNKKRGGSGRVRVDREPLLRDTRSRCNPEALTESREARRRDSLQRIPAQS
jgi:hypothetical protein